MAGLDFQIDPKTGDLVDGTDGWFKELATAGAALFYQLTHHYNAWWGDPDAGSELHMANQKGDGPQGQEFLEVEVTRALGVLVTAGLIADVQVRVTRPKAGRLLIEVSCRDVQSGQPLEAEIDPFTAGVGG